MPNDAGFADRLKTRIADAISPVTEPITPSPLPPIDEMEAENIAVELWQRTLIFEFDGYKPYFEKWWRALDRELQRRLHMWAEMFSSHEDWFQRMIAFDGGDSRDLAGRRTQADWKTFRASLPSVSPLEFRRAQSDPQHAALLRKRFKEAEQWIGSLFNVRANRPIENAERDRWFSLLRYAGQSDKKIEAAFRTRYLHGARGPKLSESMIRKAIAAHRRRSQKTHWALLVSIFVTEFPNFRSKDQPPVL